MNAEQRMRKAVQILDDLIELENRDLAECQRCLAEIKKPAAPTPQRKSRKFRAMTWKVRSNPQDIPQPL
jgi:hypothetical protein